MWPLERAWEGWRRRGSSSRAEGEERHGCGKTTEMRYWKCLSAELGLGSREGKGREWLVSETTMVEDGSEEFLGVRVGGRRPSALSLRWSVNSRVIGVP